MKYRSYNSEILIATTLLVNVFNDIIIDRRKHGLNRDFSKAVSLNDIIQQEIEIPCVLGDRSAILKSLENEPGRYKLPIIILQNKSIKSDASRMVDLHSDVFYQVDEQFSKLDVSHHLYKPQQLSKRRGQPIIIDYDMTIITKYKEDIDQIFSNWAVHFRPDIYVKWWHPRIKENPLTSQILWSHNISNDLPIEYNPQNIFTYKLTTSFSFKSWLFYGMHSTENEFVDGGLIKKIKLFPNRSSEYDENDLVSGKKDVNDYDDVYVFGNIINDIDSINDNDIINDNDGINDNEVIESGKNISDFSFYGVESDQDFVNDRGDDEGLKQGKYAVDNVYAENRPLISGDPILTGIKNNELFGDFFSTTDKYLINDWSKYQTYLIIDNKSSYLNKQAMIKNVWFKGGFNKDDIYAAPPSGDFLFDKFYKKYDTETKSFVADFGQNYTELSKINISYDHNSKNLIITSNNSDRNYAASIKNVLNSSTGIIQEFEIASKLDIKKIGMKYHKEFDKNLNENKNAYLFEKHNINVINGQNGMKLELLKANSNEHKIIVFKILNLIKSMWNSINLVEQTSTRFEMQFEDPRFKDILYEKDLEHYSFRTLTLICESYKDECLYQVLCNDYFYVVLKTDEKKNNETDIFDIGPFVPVIFQEKHAILYEITVPESKMLLGLNIFMKY